MTKRSIYLLPWGEFWHEGLDRNCVLVSLVLGVLILLLLEVLGWSGYLGGVLPLHTGLGAESDTGSSKAGWLVGCEWCPWGALWTVVGGVAKLLNWPPYHHHHQPGWFQQLCLVCLW